MYICITKDLILIKGSNKREREREREREKGRENGETQLFGGIPDKVHTSVGVET